MVNQFFGVIGGYFGKKMVKNIFIFLFNVRSPYVLNTGISNTKKSFFRCIIYRLGPGLGHNLLE